MVRPLSGWGGGGEPEQPKLNTPFVSMFCFKTFIRTTIHMT